MATKAEVRQRVGEDLALVPIGQDLESQDQARIDATFCEVFEKLKEKGLASFPSTGPVPTKIVPYFCLLMEQTLATSYSIPDNRFLRITTAAGPDGMLALGKLAEMALQEYTSTDTPQDF